MPYTPQENAQAERLNKTLCSKARASLISSQLPHECWKYAIADTNDKYNHTIHQTTKSIPQHDWDQAPLILQTFQPFGQHGHAVVLKDHKTKLQPRAYPCRYLQRHNSTHYTILNTTTNKIKYCRAKDFQPYTPERDSTSTARAVHTETPNTLTQA